ncbi:MAG: hypothetical protein K1X35_03480 [Caulobacteraceae bacterium]|nr:hypothetical protein [Caulobacteraceae bacterium]
MSDLPPRARLDLVGGDVLELTDYETGDPPGVVRRLTPWGSVRWSVAGTPDDPFIDLSLQGDEVLAVSWQGRLHRIGVDDGGVRSVSFVK